MDKDEQRDLLDEGEALEKAIEFPPKALTKWPGTPPWDPNREQERRGGVNALLERFRKQKDEELEEYNAPPQKVVDDKHRMQDWAEECTLWEKGESIDDRRFRLEKKFDELFGKPETTTTVKGSPLPMGHCCVDGLVFVRKPSFPMRNGETRPVADGYVMPCRDCPEGGARAEALRELRKKKGR